MNKTTFVGTLRAAAEQHHPAQQRLEFVFTDYFPNVNKQGVPREEAANIIASAANMPVKVNFKNKPKGHSGAIPIGPILSLHEEDDRIIGEAIVWREEFPDVAAFLDRAMSSGTSPQFSWELFFQDSELDADGVQWLRGTVVAGITLVDVPAYQGRTPLLAVAEEKQMEELQRQVEELTAKLATLTTAVSEKDTQIAQLQTSVAELQTAKTALEAEAEELRTYKADAEKAAAEQQTLTTRRQKMVEAGLDMTDEVFAKRRDTFLEMSDTAFQAYVEDLALTAKAQKTSASANDRIVIPDPTIGTNQISFKDMGLALRQRGN